MAGSWRDIETQLAIANKRKYWPIVPVVVATIGSTLALFVDAVLCLGILVGGIGVAVYLRSLIGVRCPSCKRMIRMYGSGTQFVKLLSLKQCPYCETKFDGP